MSAEMNHNLYLTLRAAYEHRLDSIFLRVPGEAALTYRSVDDRSARMAGALVALGVNTFVPPA